MIAPIIEGEDYTHNYHDLTGIFYWYPNDNPCSKHSYCLKKSDSLISSIFQLVILLTLDGIRFEIKF